MHFSETFTIEQFKKEVTKMGILDSLLDQNVADIEDLPSYKVPPPGFYKLLIKQAEQKVVKISGDREAPCLNMGYKILEVMELKQGVDPKEINRDEAGQPNQEFNETYFFIPGQEHEKTVQAIKTAFKEVAEKLGLTTMKALVESLEGLEVYAVVENRKDKDDKERLYAKVTNVKLA
jgi:hypothetical protein